MPCLLVALWLCGICRSLHTPDQLAALPDELYSRIGRAKHSLDGIANSVGLGDFRFRECSRIVDMRGLESQRNTFRNGSILEFGVFQVL